MADTHIDLTLEDGSSPDAAGDAAAAAAPAAANGLQELHAQLQETDEELLDVEESLAALRSRQQELRRRREELQRHIAAEQRAPRADWRADFPWTQQLQASLTSVFGLQAFRPLQREVINATLQGRDVFCQMPSGGGKSLCYQLPAIISGGVTLVVSPLLSLIVDQVMGLQGRVQAYSLTSLTSKDDTAATMAALTAAASAVKPQQGGGVAGGGDAMLLYVTPEKIVASKRLMSKLEKVYQAGRLARIAIDECHCASTWGNDFRPDYKKLSVLKQQFPTTSILALTATATVQVCKDVQTILGISGAELFSASINRSNLYYEVQYKGADDFGQLKTWILEHYPQPRDQGIIYCLTRKDCEQLAEKLNATGITAAAYHANMEPATRSASQTAWSQGHIKVMVATIAFGMGINAHAVRFVVHDCLSKSLENLYQESGRAGRDGRPARCVLFYRLSDVLRQAAVVCYDHDWGRHLMAVTAYAAASKGCRRAALAAHFAEPAPPCNGTCDLCAPAGAAAGAGSRQQQQDRVDVTTTALLVLQLLKERKGEKRATLNQLLDDMQKAGRKHGAGSSGSGGSGSSRQDHEHVVQEMLLQGLLSLEFGFTAFNTNTYLAASAAGDAFAAAGGRQRFDVVPAAWVRGERGGQAPATQQQQQQQQQQQRRRRQRQGQAATPAEGSDGLQDSESRGAGGSGEDDDDDDDDFLSAATARKRQRS